jgi:hypothetical protein
MKQFEFLAVFVSIILALGISHTLSSTMRLIHRRSQVRLHLPTLIWLLTLFLAQIFVWWLAFQRIDTTTWTFFRFLFYLMVPTLVSVPGYLLVPEIELELQPIFDLQENFNHNRKWFFAILATFGIAAYIESGFSAGEFVLHIDNVVPHVDNALPLLLSAVSIAGFTIQTKRGQLLVSLAFLATLLCYIGIVFIRL